MKKKLPDGDYILKDGRIWVETHGIAICVWVAQGEVRVAAYRSGQEMAPALAELSVCQIKKK